MEQPGRREGLERRRSKGPCDSQHPQQPWANVECIAFSPDGKLLAAANWNGRRACMDHRFVEVAAEHINLLLKCGMKLSAN